jgi:23S rRNA (cytosine1962-C5)-methyltransferase
MSDIPNCLQIMDSLPAVLLKPGEADRIVAGHPWIYHSEILRLSTPPADGELVQVKDHRQRLLGVGFFNSKSKINVRVLAPERVEVNEAFLSIAFAPRSPSVTNICREPRRFASSTPKATFSAA